MGCDMHMDDQTVSLPADYQPHYGGQPGYFRISVWGMPFVRVALDRSSVLDTNIARPILEAASPPVGLSEDRDEGSGPSSKVKNLSLPGPANRK